MDNITIKTTRNKQLNFRRSLHPNGRLHEPPISESLEMGLTGKSQDKMKKGVEEIILQ